jgi:hypothetical protein
VLPPPTSPPPPSGKDTLKIVGDMEWKRRETTRVTLACTVSDAIMPSVVEQAFLKRKWKAAIMMQTVWRGHMLGWNRKNPSLLFKTNKAATRSRMASTTGNKKGLIYPYDHITSTQVTSPYSRRTASVLKKSPSWSLRLGDALQSLRLESISFTKGFGKTSGSGVSFGK